MLGLRESQPIGFGGLLVAHAGRVVFVETGSLVDRLRASIPGAFAVMSIVLVLVLSVRLAQRLQVPLAPLLVGSVAAFVLALPRPALHSFKTFAATLGISGLFTKAIVCCVGDGRGDRPRCSAPVPGLRRSTARCVRGRRRLARASYALHVSTAALLAALLSPLGLLGDSFIALFLITADRSDLVAVRAFTVPRCWPRWCCRWLPELPIREHRGVRSSSTAAASGRGLDLSVRLSRRRRRDVAAGVLLLLRSRVPRLRTFAFATVLPSLVNVNEPVMFGLPIVYNPVLGIPYLLAPLALVCTTYAALALHLVRAPIYYVPSTLPLFVNVFLATFDWRADLLILVNVLVAGAIYLPFVRMYERIEAKLAAEAA